MAAGGRREMAGGIQWVRALARRPERPLDGLEDLWREALDRALRRCRWDLLEAGFRPEGYQLILRTPQCNLSLGMLSFQRELAAARARRFPERSGALFAGRFRSDLLLSEACMSTASEAIGRWVETGEAVTGAVRRLLREEGADVTVGARRGGAAAELEADFKACLDYFDLDREALPQLAKSSRVKQLMAVHLHEHHSVSVRELAGLLHMGHPSALSRVLGKSDALALDLARLKLALEVTGGAG